MIQSREGEVAWRSTPHHVVRSFPSQRDGRDVIAKRLGGITMKSGAVRLQRSPGVLSFTALNLSSLAFVCVAGDQNASGFVAFPGALS
ncbi:MAG: hypothetical protein AB1898_07710 [Acidobacteriota bacterium]